MTANAGCLARSIVLLRRSDGSPLGEPRTRPRDMPGYRGDGPSKALEAARLRQRAVQRERLMLGSGVGEATDRLARLDVLWIEQRSNERETKGGE